MASIELGPRNLPGFVHHQVYLFNVHGTSDGPIIIGQGQIERLEMSGGRLMIWMKWYGEAEWHPKHKATFTKKGDRFLSTASLGMCLVDVDDEGVLSIAESSGRNFSFYPPGHPQSVEEPK